VGRLGMRLKFVGYTFLFSMLAGLVPQSVEAGKLQKKVKIDGETFEIPDFEFKNTKAVKAESFAFQDGYRDSQLVVPEEDTREEPFKDIEEDEVQEDFGVKVKRSPASGPR
jgi:hypothetical protein